MRGMHCRPLPSRRTRGWHSTPPLLRPITCVVATPSALEPLLAANVVPQSVQCVVLGGEPVPLRLVDALHASGHVRRVLNSFGPTECTDQCATAVLLPGERAPTVGGPIANVQL